MAIKTSHPAFLLDVRNGAARGPTVLTGSSRAVKREVEDVAMEEGHTDATQLALKMEEGP